MGLAMQGQGVIDAMMNTLVMIPAFGCDARLYEPQVAALQEFIRIQIISVDADDYDGMVRQVLAEVTGDFAVLGTSMGARVALEVTLGAPRRVAALCMIGAGAGPTLDVAAGQRRSARIRNGEKDVVIAEMADMVSHVPGPLGEATRAAFIAMGHDMEVDTLGRQSDALAKRIDLWLRLPEIQCPTLCLWGEHDKFSPPADGLRIAHDVVDGGYTELPDCGHFPTLEYPLAATEAIANWLEDAELI